MAAATETSEKLIFVYGTLKRGFYNHTLIQSLIQAGDASYVGAGTTVEPYPLVCGPHNIPYLICLPGSGQPIKGELYSVSSGRGLARLDELEGVAAGHYERLPLDVDLILEEGKKRVVSADAYFAHRGFGEALWRRCGGGGDSCGAGTTSEYTVDIGNGYVPRQDRPENWNTVADIHNFINEKGSHC